MAAKGDPSLSLDFKNFSAENVFQVIVGFFGIIRSQIFLYRNVFQRILSNYGFLATLDPTKVHIHR